MSIGARTASGGVGASGLKGQADRQSQGNARRDGHCIVHPKESLGERRMRLLGQLDELLATVDGVLDESNLCS